MKSMHLFWTSQSAWAPINKHILRSLNKQTNKKTNPKTKRVTAVNTQSSLNTLKTIMMKHSQQAQGSACVPVAGLAVTKQPLRAARWPTPLGQHSIVGQIEADGLLAAWHVISCGGWGLRPSPCQACCATGLHPAHQGGGSHNQGAESPHTEQKHGLTRGNSVTN